MLSRRKLTTLVASAALDCSISKQSQAQSPQLASAVKLVRQQTDQLAQNLINAKSPLLKDDAREFVANETSIIRGFLEVTEKYSVDELRGAIDSNFKPLVDRFLEEGIALAPPQAEIKPLRLELEEECKEKNKFLIIIKFILDTLELSTLQQLLETLADEYPPIRESLEELSAALQVDDWRLVIKLLSKIVDLMMQEATLQWISRRYSQAFARNVFIQIARAATKRLAPFVGTILLATGIAAAFKLNYNCLLKLIRTNP
jgi:hypothetical protein